MKITKKLIAAFLSVLMLMSAVSVGFVSSAVVCNHNIGENYPNSTMVEYSRIKATCQAEGTAFYECTNCDHTTSKPIPKDPDNHAFGYWTPVEGKEPGCATEGEKIRYCDCGASETGVLPATGKHTFVDESLLDFWWTEENIGVGSEYKGWTILEIPTCISTGRAKTLCTECGIEGKYAELHLHSADFKEVTRDEATCHAEGKSYVICTKCNANYTLTIPVNEDNHVDIWKVTTEATCSKEGVESLYCQWHEELGVLDTRPIPTKEHSFTNYKYDNNGTCTEDGTKTAKCDNCDAKDTVIAEGTAKSCLKRWQFKDAKNNCASGGEAELRCVYCKELYDTKTFAAGEHLNLIIMTQDVTCEKDGYKYHKCDSCGEKLDAISGTEIKSEGHDMVWTVTIPASCISKQKGEELGTCTRCGATETRKFDYKHDYNDLVPAVAATCKTDGMTAHLRCSLCYDEVPPIPVKAFGHSDADGNGCCDTCYEWFLEGDVNGTSCRCLCHNPDGIAALFYKIYLFFIKLFGAAQVCDCGAIHYEK